ncbi:MAG: FAD-dependent oxidoreductase [Proteobacteria bacterium]|nr:FAD-dependent oxidoreductase [Pseudomonadota bacterium]
MSNVHSPLLEPGRIGALELRNRIIMAPMGSNFAEADGRCGERIQAYYEARAKGGAALLTMGVVSIAYPSGTSSPYQVGISNDDYIPGLTEMARRAHKHGAKIAAQLQHAGKTAMCDLAEGRPVWVPSLPPKPSTSMMGALTKEELTSFASTIGRHKPQFRVLDKGDIEQLIEWYAAAAARAQAAGFDGIELHAGHTYLVAGFLSPYYNQRDDEYGGSLENRARLMVEMIRGVKARVGAGFPVWVRLDGEELRSKGGITLPDAVGAARLAVEAGAVAVSMSAYATFTTGVAFTEAPTVHEPGRLMDYATEVRKAVSVPVIAAGRISPQMAAEAIAAGRFDFVAMARKLLADPELPRKLVQGRARDVRPCNYCYVCISEIFLNSRIKCPVNAELGHEAEAGITPAAAQRHVLVIGGGPAGMEAARVAATRGHRVTLVERSERLGGALAFAALGYAGNAPLLDNLVHQVRELPIDVQLATAADAALVGRLKPDAVVVASGARRGTGGLAGAGLAHVWTCDELQRQITLEDAGGTARIGLPPADAAAGAAKTLGKRVVVIGGGMVGLELADYLLAHDRTVTVLEPTDKAGRELSIALRWRVMDAVEQRGSIQRSATVREITPTEVVWADAEGKEQRTGADSVLIAREATPDTGVAELLKDCGVPLHLAGDCRGVEQIEGAIRDGFRVGCEV